MERRIGNWRNEEGKGNKRRRGIDTWKDEKLSEERKQEKAKNEVERRIEK